MRPALALALLLATAPGTVAAAAQTTDPFEIHITLSKAAVLLGEPVWVEVSVTNRSAQTLAVDWGTACPDFHTTPLTIEVPNATSGDGEPKNCGGYGGSCMTPGPSTFAPGHTESRRYVLAGDFRITHPGTYEVIVHKPLRYGAMPLKDAVFLPHDQPTQTGVLHATLEVLPPNPAKLLALEQELATAAATRQPEPKLVTAPGLSAAEFQAAVRAWSEERRQYFADSSRRSYEIYEALSLYPAAGMEPVFVAWQTPPRQVGYGVSALYHLNTPEAREALGRFTEVPTPIPGAKVDKSTINSLRFTAAWSLARMGDATYLPLLKQLAADENRDVRMTAIIGVGLLGGEGALPFLEHILRNAASDEDRRDAMQAMANTGSAKAVPLLIDAITSPKPSDDGTYWLMSLTHHQLANLGRQRTPQEAEAAWRAWWTIHQNTANIFGPNDCGNGFDQ